jgi:hypothetical protein
MSDNFSAFVALPKEKYEGQWVVLLNKEVVASGTAKEIKERLVKIRKKYPKEVPFLAKVPHKTLQIV